MVDIALQEIYKEGIKIWYVNSFKWPYYSIFAALMIDYKEQVLITDIKTNMQYFIYYILPSKREIVTKLWDFQTYESTWE